MAEKRKRLHASRRLRAQRISNTVRGQHLQADNRTLHVVEKYIEHVCSRVCRRRSGSCPPIITNWFFDDEGEKLIGNVYNHPIFANGTRITTAIVKAPSNAQQNTIVATRRGTKNLLINTAFLTDPAGEETRCEKAVARRQQKRRGHGRTRLIGKCSSPGEQSLRADNRLVQANFTIAALRTKIRKLSAEGTTDAATSNRKVPDRERQDLVRQSKRRQKKMADSKQSTGQSEYINGKKY